MGSDKLLEQKNLELSAKNCSCCPLQVSCKIATFLYYFIRTHFNNMFQISVPIDAFFRSCGSNNFNFHTFDIKLTAV